MKQASRKSKIHYPISEKVVKNIREGLVFISLGFALYLLIALFSYNQDDSSWSYSIDTNTFQNNFLFQNNHRSMMRFCDSYV